MIRFRTSDLAVASLILLISPASHAFGLGDVISATIQVGAKVGGALVDQAVDSMTDHEAEAKRKEAERVERERKMLAQVQKTIDEVEAKKDLTPYQREKLKLAVIDAAAQGAAMMTFVDDMEARQAQERRNARERLFTPTGMLETAAGAVANTPSEVMAEANQLSKSADFKQHIREGMPSAQSPSDKLLAALERSQAGAVTEQKLNTATSDARKQVEGQLAPSLAKAEIERDSMRSKLSALRQPVPESFFSRDAERKIFVEYIDSEKETARLRKILGSQGYQLVGSRAEADVYYCIEGEYMIDEAKTHKGVAMSSGIALSQPQAVKPPDRKEPSALKSVVSSLFSALGKPPTPTQKSSEQPYMQSVFLVASRQAADEKEIRVSAKSNFSALYLATEDLLARSHELLYTKLGLFSLIKEKEETGQQAREGLSVSEERNG